MLNDRKAETYEMRPIFIDLINVVGWSIFIPRDISRRRPNLLSSPDPAYTRSIDRSIDRSFVPQADQRAVKWWR